MKPETFHTAWIVSWLGCHNHTMHPDMRRLPTECIMICDQLTIVDEIEWPTANEAKLMKKPTKVMLISNNSAVDFGISMSMLLGSCTSYISVAIVTLVQPQQVDWETRMVPKRWPTVIRNLAGITTRSSRDATILPLVFFSFSIFQLALIFDCCHHLLVDDAFSFPRVE
jgi:hypothetical protein